jgi:hypothetical protein
LLNTLVGVDDSRSVEEMTAGIQKHTQWVGRRVRALCPWGKDQELLAAINHGDFRPSTDSTPKGGTRRSSRPAEKQGFGPDCSHREWKRLRG